MIDPHAIGSLPTAGSIARVELRGRVVQVEPAAAAFVLWDESGSARVHGASGEAAPVLGAWVSVTGRWASGAVHEARVRIETRPTRDFGRGDSDWALAQPDRLVALRIRHAILALCRQYFDDAGFTEVETPNLVRSPGLELHLDALEVEGAGERRYLHTSPEYHMKRLLSAGMSRIYQLCKVYRRGELGSLHQPEFTMLEWYRTFCGMDDLIADTELLVYSVVARVRGGHASLPARPGRMHEIDVTPPWERLRVEQAFERYADRPLADVLPDEELFNRILVEQIEPRLGTERPTVLTHYPAAMASLARLTPGDPSVAERFEVYVDGVELCNGFGELTDAAEQRSRLEADARTRGAQGRAVYPIDERFVGALADGIPPSGGNALGIDRLIMLALGAERIDEVVAFPAEWV